MDVAVDPNVALLAIRERLKQLLDVEDFGVELHVGVDPLPVQVDASDRVPVIAADNTVRVQDGDEDEGIELAEELGFLAIGSEEFEDSLEHGACRRLARGHARRYDNVRLLLQVLRVPRYDNLPKRQAARRATQLLPLVVNELVLVLKLDAFRRRRAIFYLLVLLGLRNFLGCASLPTRLLLLVAHILVHVLRLDECLRPHDR